jgi:hypothetical protein
MRYQIILPVLLVYANSLFSQAGTKTLTMSQDFSQIAQPTKGGTGAYQTYSSKQVNGSQFFLPEWHEGEVETNTNEVFKTGFFFSYDKVRQELFIRKADASDILQGEKDKITFFTLDDGDKQYHFANSSVFSSATPFVFYQLLVYDSSKITLLKLVKTTFVKADPNDMMRVQQGDIYDSYVDKYSYYLSKGSKDPVEVQLKTKSLKKSFTQLNIDPDKYLDAHNEPVNEDYLVAMVRQLNQ